MSSELPYIVELDPQLNAAEAFRALANQRHCVFLDSARRSSSLSQFSFCAVDPFEVLVGEESLDELERHLAHFLPLTNTSPDHETPLPGGAIGYFSYDLGRSFEELPAHRYNEFELPALCVGLYDVVLTFDHTQERAFIVSQGFPETDLTRRHHRAIERAEQVLAWLQQPAATRDAPTDAEVRVLPADQLAPQFETRCAGVTSNFSAEQYVAAVQQGIDYIHAGDVFQVNLAQRLLCRAASDSVSLYLRLRKENAAPFAAYFDTGEHQILSASPERFVQVTDRLVETRPIKGTRPRRTHNEADLFTGAELTASGKDLAENVMIVDLMRNDLSRICEDDSIRVPKLCGLETYEHVQHLVSVVQGRLRDGISNIELLRCAFPGGSITGAPKIRAMEIIAELEPTTRGPYCGSLGYLGFGGAADLNILIRTVSASQGWWQFPVGGGVVADSDPEAELRETWAKAEGILQAVLDRSTI